MMNDSPTCAHCHERYQPKFITITCRVCADQFCSYACRDAHQRRENHERQR